MSESLATLPSGITINDLMRLTSIEILITYGPEVYKLVSNLQASGIVPRDGRSNQDLAIQAAMRAKIAAEGDCGPADLYKAELEGK